MLEYGDHTRILSLTMQTPINPEHPCTMLVPDPARRCWVDDWWRAVAAGISLQNLPGAFRKVGVPYLGSL